MRYDLYAIADDFRRQLWSVDVENGLLIAERALGGGNELAVHVSDSGSVAKVGMSSDGQMAMVPICGQLETALSIIRKHRKAK